MKRRYWTIGHRLPAALTTPLFGDRCKFGQEIRQDDPDWSAWQQFSLEFYQRTQKRGLGKMVNDAGYEILRHVDLTDRNVLEIGPGSLPHRRFWTGRPSCYAVVDVRREFLECSMRMLKQDGLDAASFVLSGHALPLENECVDVLISFYSLEHLHPLSDYLREFCRVMHPGGLLVGGIPCEGGLAWGGGRWLTTRRYIKKHTGIDPDKIICWEHPNYAEHILQALACRFTPVRLHFWPLWVPLVDFNLICTFIYRKGTEENEG